MIIYPDNIYKMLWDIFVCIILIMSCAFTPVDLAFPMLRA